MKGGGSITLRSREILNADTITGVFNFNNNMTSNCAGQPAGCTVNSTTGFDVASFMLGYVNTKNRNLFDANTYTEKRPEYSPLRAGRLSASTSRLTLNLGLRWDVYVPWVEKDDRQSNFDESTGRFVVASDDAVINGVEVGRYLQTYSKGDLGSAVRFRLRPRTAAARRSCAAASACSGTSRPAARRRRRRRTRRSCSRRRSTPNPTAYGTNLLLKDGLPPPPGVDPEPAGGRHDALDLRHQLPRRLRAAVEPQRPALAVHELHAGGGLRRLAGPARCSSRATRTRRRPVVGVTDSNVNRPVRQDLAGAAHGRPGAEPGARSTTTRCW